MGHSNDAKWGTVMMPAHAADHAYLSFKKAVYRTHGGVLGEVKPETLK